MHCIKPLQSQEVQTIINISPEMDIRILNWPKRLEQPVPVSLLKLVILKEIRVTLLWLFLEANDVTNYSAIGLRRWVQG